MGKKKKRRKAKLRKPLTATKQRTREHVIESLSANFVEGIVYELGYTVERVKADYGYDLTVTTFDSSGYVEPGVIFIQLKATDSVRWVSSGAEVSFTIESTDYRHWTMEAYPVFLVVFDAKSRSAYWLYVQKYFSEDSARRPVVTAQSVTVRIPITQILDSSSIEYMRVQKAAVMAEYMKVKHG